MTGTILFSLTPAVFYVVGIFYRPLLFGGLVVQFVYLLTRGLALGRVPLVGLHDTFALLAASLVAFSLPFYKYVSGRREYFFMLSGMAVLLTLLSALSKPNMRPLPPVLKTYWFELHVILSFFSYALFGIAAILGILYLIRKGEDAEGAEAPYERLQYKAVLIGYSLFSLSMIFGGVWAYLAWGSYWLWTPKELWTTLLWVYYSLYLHARLLRWWSGTPSAVLGTVGFLVVMFTYVGVGLLMKSSHSF